MANIIVCSRFPQNLKLEVLINGELKSFVINGSKTDLTANQENKNNLHGAMAMTTVDEDLYNAWLEANKDNKLVKNQFIFTAKTEKSAKAQKEELKDESTGLEGLGQEGDKRAGGKKIAKG
ncbi:hypothetical protein DES39_0546 [Orbus hercynius]|uniref:Uncharacterized protein n=1 Tax=Orbus hercynius TaxID=593135 RepID=A0A495RJI1_9GAMM|nr:hypothetical protein [Orbus hercynius]RKS87326.1 hypothetical protein DES39_0546 [Orbus hercynius]